MQPLSSVDPAITMNRARDEPDQRTTARSPRLWCPGLVFVTRQGDVRLGRSVGYSSRDLSFLHLGCGYRSRIEYWAHEAWLVSRSALNAHVLAEHAIVLPESLVDRDAQPHAHNWLRQQPLVCVSGSTWRRLSAAGVHGFRVAFDASGDRVLDVEDTGGIRKPSSVRVALDALEDAVAVACHGRPPLEVQGDPSSIDRVLRLVSGDVLDEQSVLNAFDARCLVEDGYGYRGSLEGRFNEIADITRKLGPVDVLFGQIFERAKTMGAVAMRVLELLAQATPRATAVSLPLYDVARPAVVPALHVPWVDRLVLSGLTMRDLELPAERRWSVRGVDAWGPRFSPQIV